ncbi:MAG: hypothetical protein JOZ54_08910 [Acidobacteria bacterium]|nr:hypothetical protein [Acidobacteriota bacterium]
MCAGLARGAAAQTKAAAADVVVIVDTSVSMRDPGMDPARTSLLVTRLFADIVPGDLAVVRLLGIDDDADVIPSMPTGDSIPCGEDPTKTCRRVEQASDWEADARAKKLGALIRPSRGDAAYKQQLPAHLEQRIRNSMFYLAFRTAQGIFESHGETSVPRTVIWLSDGRSDGPEVVKKEVQELTAGGVAVEAMVFGRGDTQLATESGLTPRRVSTPAETMKAFAGAFRRIVQAPYEIDNLVAAQPAFDIKPNVDEAWIVVYGDDTLGDVSLDGPGGSVPANYAVDQWPGAGAYKVAYLQRPTTGRWTVHAAGGGSGVAYAVVQRSALTPMLLEPKVTIAGARSRLVAAINAGRDGEPITDPELLRDVAVTAEFQGQTITLLDNGAHPDAATNDGRFSALGTFTGSGSVPVRLRVRSPMVDRTVLAVVQVSGRFHYEGGPIEVDLGVLGVETEVCRPLALRAEHEGEVPFELKELLATPSGHTLTMRLPSGKLVPGRDARVAKKGDRFEVCLATTRLAPSSKANGETWLELRVAGSDAADHKIPIRLRWQVHGLSFWQRWGWLILLILGLLLLAFVVAGFLLPTRFHGTLAIVFVPERYELEDQTPQPVLQWKGVGIGFYRDARAYLHADYRVSGKAQGALASLHAEKGGARVMPGRGLSLYRETLEGDWEGIPAIGSRARGGDVYRIGDRGPYFRIATRGRS